jgi:peptide-methionine (S)-S-oxide reductase
MKTKYFAFPLFILLALSSCAQKPNNKAIAKKDPLSAKDLSKYSVATFAAGCFWHEEALFESIKGVKEAVSGYAGGTTTNPTYGSIEEGNTGHAETVNVYYNPAEISYSTLLKVYFAGQDPTQVNGQGNDLGTQYRSIVFYRNNNEKQLTEAYIKQLNASGKYNNPIAVQVVPFIKFWDAEDYHQDYIVKNPNQGYVQAVSIPEIKHLQKLYPELIKPNHVF